MAQWITMSGKAKRALKFFVEERVHDSYFNTPASEQWRLIQNCYAGANGYTDAHEYESGRYLLCLPEFKPGQEYCVTMRLSGNLVV